MTTQTDTRTSTELFDAEMAAFEAKDFELACELHTLAYAAKDREDVARPVDEAKKLREDAIWRDEQAEWQKVRAELAATPLHTYPRDEFNRGYDASEGEY